MRGYFNCVNNKLTSLKGAPKTVGGYFDCSNNPKLKSLDALLGTEIKGKLYTNLDASEFKEDQKMFIKVHKDLKKFKALKRLLQVTKV